MREIKFRCWDLKNSKWHTPTEWGEEPADAYIGYGDTPEIGFRSNEDYVWLQFTGLTDKNGKDVYEGDILTTDMLGSKKERLLHVVGYEMYGLSNARSGFVLPAPLYEFKVIGNIYENEDLLK